MYVKSIEEGKKRLVSVLLELAIGERPVTTCRQVVSEKLPQYIKDNIIIQARRRIREEKPLNWNFSAHFDFDDNDVQNLQRPSCALLQECLLYPQSRLRRELHFR